MKKDIFCKIVNKEVISFPVYEDGDILAFLDIEPKTVGHTIIVTKKHFDDIESIDSETGRKIFIAAQKISKSLKDLFKYDGVVLLQINGEKAQDIRHFHMHIYGENLNQKNNLYKSFKNEKEKKDYMSEVSQKIKENVVKLL